VIYSDGAKMVVMIEVVVVIVEDMVVVIVEASVVEVATVVVIEEAMVVVIEVVMVVGVREVAAEIVVDHRVAMVEADLPMVTHSELKSMNSAIMVSDFLIVIIIIMMIIEHHLHELHYTNVS